MNIKKFIAHNSREALKMVKKSMGDDVVILKTRTIPWEDNETGIRSQRVEVTAAVDYNAPVVMAPSSKVSSSTDIKGTSEPNNQKGLEYLEKDIKEIKEAVLSGAAGNILSPEIYFNQDLKELYMNYKTFGLNDRTISKLMHPQERVIKGSEKPSFNLVKEALQEVLSKISINGGNTDYKGQKIFSFIGATGVGKTTTLAKLAAMSVVNQHKKIALITLDTFRVAAVAQLQTYARIMDVPVEVVGTRDELRDAIERHNDCDRIFIDTAGRSPNNKNDIAELNDVLNIHDDIHTYLVLSATTQYKNLLNSEKKFGVLPYKSFIFTKLDEAQERSTMIDFLVSCNKPISYFGIGQQVPEDIESASKKKLATFLLSEMKSSNSKGLND